MDPAKRLALVKALSVAKSFDPILETGSRDWFVETVIKGFEAAGNGDAQVEQKTKDLVAATKTLVAAERDFALALTADGNKRYTAKVLKDLRRNRVEILYGLIGREPKFAEAAQRDYLRFLAKRRFRSVCRMFLWVNPNRVGYFRYRKTCKEAGMSYWRLNEDAAPSLWQPPTPATAGVPIKLNAAGLADPPAAIKKIFTLKSTPCRGNLFDCSGVAEILAIDALMESKEPGRFLTAISTPYVEINLIDDSGFSHNPGAPENPISKVSVPMPPRDLQVGDECYIYNHPLYKTFVPTGAWTGEFAYVYAAGNRDHRSEKGFVFGGHGKEGTLFAFYAAFVKDLAGHLATVRQLARGHLAFMRGGAAAIAPGTVISDIEDDITVNGTSERYRLIAYDLAVTTRDFTKVPTRTKRKPKTTSPGFLIAHSKTAGVFYLALVDNPDQDLPLAKNLRKTLAELPTPRKIKYPVKVTRLTPAQPGDPLSEIFGIENWGIAYTDHATGTEKLWPFFEKVGTKFKRKELTTAPGVPIPSLFDSPFALFTSGGSDIESFQPRVDFGAHRTFLSSNGAF